jgi:hypothetical protein
MQTGALDDGGAGEGSPRHRGPPAPGRQRAPTR